jgi:hypothetical protein
MLENEHQGRSLAKAPPKPGAQKQQRECDEGPGHAAEKIIGHARACAIGN